MTEILLTPEQSRAATTIDRSIGIIANAGSGKTRVLVERVSHILTTEGIALSKILVVTFTEKAAQELKNRLAARLPERRLELMSAPITTFHGFATRVLRDHAPALGLSPAFQISSEGEAATLMHRAVEETILKLLDQKNPDAEFLCRRFKFRSLVQQMIPLLEDRWSFEQYLLFSKPQLPEPRPVQTGGDDDVTTAIAGVFRYMASRYQALKNADDVLDFHDLEILTWKLFRDDPRILSDYQRKFRHLLVDEFQDTNPLQAEIVRQLFTPPDNILCIVGDPKQSIYKFRRADVSCFADMLAVITDSGGETIILPDNFRSTPGIIDFVNAACADIPHYTQLVARAEAQPYPSVIPVLLACDPKASKEERRVCEAEAVAKQIPALAQRHGGHDAIACLFRTRATLQIWADIFQKQGLPIHIYGSRGFWERPEIRTLLFPLHVLSGLITQQPSDRHLLAMLISPLFAVSLDEVYRWMKLSTLPDSDLPPLHNAVFANSTVGTQLQAWRDATGTHTPHELLSRIIQDTHYRQTLAQQDPSGQAEANIDALLRRIHLIGKARALPLPALLAQLVSLQEMDERTTDAPATIIHDDAIQLMTIHAAKGNEFPVVVLSDLFHKPTNKAEAWIFEPGIGFAVRYEDEFAPEAEDTPAWVSLKEQFVQDEMAERARLLYVALTRAERQLVLPLHSDLADKDQKGLVSWHERLYPIARDSQ